jgi:SAM-dependent MidA family methyltransferase
MSDSLLAGLIQEIESTRRRAIAFPRFMEQALYHPVWGYYAKEQTKLGKKGDFFTNAHVGDLFGKVLSRFFADWLKRNQIRSRWTIVEWGAGDGRIAEQFAQGLMEQGFSPEAISFYLIETSPYHRRLLEERFSSSPVGFQTVSRLSDIPARPFSFIYSNELVDAFPVHRIKKDQGRWTEAYVTTMNRKPYLKEEWLPLSEDSPVRQQMESWLRKLKEGQEMEICLAARDWLREIAGWMEQGVLVTIDYGGTGEQLLQKGKTIRAYQAHRICHDLYSDPGEKDLTYDVNFSHLIEWGREAGFTGEQLWSQSRFLIQAGVFDWLPEAPGRDPFGEDAKRVRAIKQLIHPETMGEAFQVLIQTKSTGGKNE